MLPFSGVIHHAISIKVIANLDPFKFDISHLATPLDAIVQW